MSTRKVYSHPPIWALDREYLRLRRCLGLPGTENTLECKKMTSRSTVCGETIDIRGVREILLRLLSQTEGATECTWGKVIWALSQLRAELSCPGADSHCPFSNYSGTLCEETLRYNLQVWLYSRSRSLRIEKAQEAIELAESQAEGFYGWPAEISDDDYEDETFHPVDCKDETHDDGVDCACPCTDESKDSDDEESVADNCEDIDIDDEEVLRLGIDRVHDLPSELLRFAPSQVPTAHETQHKYWGCSSSPQISASPASQSSDNDQVSIPQGQGHSSNIGGKDLMPGSSSQSLTGSICFLSPEKRSNCSSETLDETEGKSSSRGTKRIRSEPPSKGNGGLDTPESTGGSSLAEEHFGNTASKQSTAERTDVEEARDLQSLLTLMRTCCSLRENLDPGYACIFHDASAPDHIKIGYMRAHNAVNYGVDMESFSFFQGLENLGESCMAKMHLRFAVSLPSAGHHVMKLIHETLHKERWPTHRREPECCKGGYVDHFNVTEERAREVIMAWAEFSQQYPYNEYGNLGKAWVEHANEYSQGHHCLTVKQWMDGPWKEFKAAQAIKRRAGIVTTEASKENSSKDPPAQITMQNDPQLPRDPSSYERIQARLEKLKTEVDHAQQSVSSVIKQLGDIAPTQKS